MKITLSGLIFSSVIITVAMLSGCATKQYPQTPRVTAEENELFDCKIIQKEIAQVRSIQQEIDSTGEFDGRTVLGFLGDFGIGNGMAKSSAYEKAQIRLEQLTALEKSKCE